MVSLHLMPALKLFVIVLTVCIMAGQRYEVDRSNEKLVPKLLKRGRELIRQWMVNNDASEKNISEFDEDVYMVKFALNHIPPS